MKTQFLILLAILVVFTMGYGVALLVVKSRPPEPPTTHHLNGMTYAVIEGEVVNLTKDSLEVHILEEGKAVITYKTISTW